MRLTMTQQNQHVQRHSLQVGLINSRRMHPPLDSKSRVPRPFFTIILLLRTQDYT